MTPVGIIIGLVVGLIIGAAGVFLTNKPKHAEKLRQIEQEIASRREANEREIDKILQQANRDADKTRQDADKSRRDAEQTRKDAERNAERRSGDLKASEDRLEKTQQNLDRQRSKIENREQAIGKRQGNLDRRQTDLEKIEEQRRAELEKLSSLTSEEAKEQLLAAVEAESRQDMARIMREIEDKAKENGEERARSLIAQAIQRVASDYVAETTISIVPLANDEMKGRIIGRAGRNIRAFELAAGVDVIVDDTPEAVTVSSFDSVRREIARIALSKLVVDGRIHPARIEKTISDAKKEVNKAIREAGEQAAYEANVSGLHPEIIKMMGRLKYRTSYGQNQLEHSIEASKIAAILAAEMGANVNMAKMGGFLHDIGKAMDHDQEGTHAGLGAEFIKRFKVPANVVNAVASHHHEVDQESVEAILVESADAISGARPGARRESLENYIKRVRTLEEIATSFDGVESAYALQAGREIRILVKPDAIDDLASMRLSKEVAKSIEDSMQYPGTIQVTVIRETRSVDHAK